MGFDPYKYNARLKRVIDADTLILLIDFGFGARQPWEIRLLRVDTHEIHSTAHDSDEYQRGLAETEFAHGWLEDAAMSGLEWPLFIQTKKRGSLGRYLAEVYRHEDNANLNDALLKNFEGVEYDG